MYYTSETTISRSTTICRERTLPRPGEVLVDPGDHVESTQIVGRAKVSGDFRIVPVARLLGVSTAKTEEYLKVELGSTVHRGDVIAKRGAFLGTSVESPIDGVITAAGGGRVLIEAQPAPFELHAHISGAVVSVEASQTISIETPGALVQGVWGAGQESVGVLKGMTETPSESLRAGAIDSSCHGSILVAGLTVDQEALTRAEDVEARGIVTGGLSSELLPAVESLPFPVILTAGFGHVPMTDIVFDLLRENEGREASISGQAQTRWDRERPEIIIPQPNTKPSADHWEDRGSLTPGARVRVVRAPHMGSLGTVLDIPRHARRIATGARVRCAEVDMGKGEPVFIPVFNLVRLR